MPLLSPVVMAACLVACSDPGGTAANTIDVAAAASRGQSDIANYAAAAEPRGAVSTVASPSPVPRASATAVGEEPTDVVRRYVGAIAARNYADAWRLWDGGGAASGMTEAAFAASFGRYATFQASVGAAGDEDAGTGQRYVTVPVTVAGMLRSGAPFRLRGPIILHRIADGIESDDPDAHRWRIRSSEIKSQPLPGEGSLL